MEEKQGSKRKPSFTAAAEKYIKQDGAKYLCTIDPYSGCTYGQDRYDVGNFIRHFRTQHPQAATNIKLFKETESPVKKQRIVPKQNFAIDKRLVMESCIKLVTEHHLPFNCFEWEGLKLIFDPIMETLNLHVNRHNIRVHVTKAAQHIRTYIRNEMAGKLISIKIDSASRHGRHIIGVNAQYEVNGEIVIRTLGK